MTSSTSASFEHVSRGARLQGAVYPMGLAVLPYDQRVATRWGEIQAYAQLRGRPRPTNDSWIAACCLTRDLPLVTFNTKEYADFAEHEGLEFVL